MKLNDTANIYLLSAREYAIVDNEYQVNDTLKTMPRVPYLGLWRLTDRGTINLSDKPTSLFEPKDTYANNDCIKRLLGNDTPREVIVYVHGYNNDMKDALEHAKEMLHGLVNAQQDGTEKKDYTIVIFDWPSIITSHSKSWASYIPGYEQLRSIGGRYANQAVKSTSPAEGAPCALLHSTPTLFKASPCALLTSSRMLSNALPSTQLTFKRLSFNALSHKLVKHTWSSSLYRRLQSTWLSYVYKPFESHAYHPVRSAWTSYIYHPLQSALISYVYKPVRSTLLSFVLSYPPLRSIYYMATGYNHDGDVAETSMRSLKYLVYALMSANMKTHVLGHSMGTRIVLNMFNSITHDLRVMHRILEKAHNDDDLTKTPEEVLRKHYQKKVQHLGHIILKQGDTDMTNAAEFVTEGLRTVRFYENTSKVFIFHRDDDEQLQRSSRVHKSEHSTSYRVGETEGAEKFQRMCTEEHVENSIELVSASTYTTDDSSHHSYYTSDKFWKDVNSILFQGTVKKRETVNDTAKDKKV